MLFIDVYPYVYPILSASNLRSFIYVYTHTHIFPFLPTGSALLSECLSIAFWSQFSSFQSLSPFWLFATPWTAALQAFLSIINSWSLLKLMSIKLVMSSSHLILCCPSPSPPALNLSQHQGFYNEVAVHIRWPKYWSLNFSMGPLWRKIPWWLKL